jgi:hypothetical protein
MTTTINAGIQKTILSGTTVARYYLSQTSEDQVVFAATPLIGGPEHHEHRSFSYPELEKLSPPRLRSMISRAHGVVDG